MSRVVSRGVIRVDARRAVRKLREHLLVDLDLYLLELVRAAAAGGATRIDIRHDADDVALTFDGEPLDAAVLTRLLDHVLNAAPDAASRRLRLLALGVNAALGLRPARVDLITTGRGPSGEAAGATCTRVRFTPALLEAPAEPFAPAAAPACDEVPRPPGMPAAGTRIEVRRRLGWSVLRRAITGDTLPEIAHLAAATGDFPIPIALEGEPLRRALPAASPVALVRVPFHVRGARRAALEVVAPPEAARGAARSGAPASAPLSTPQPAPPSARSTPGAAPISTRHAAPRSAPGAAPISTRHAAPRSAPGAAPISTRHAAPRSAPGAAPISTRHAAPRSAPGAAPISTRHAAPRSAPGAAPISTRLASALSTPLPTPLATPLSGLPVVDYLEHGVRLVRERWSFAPRFPSAPYQGVELPVRVVVDADELPTNASRSALREDAPLCAALRDAAAAALLDALDALAALVCGEGAVPDGVVVLDDDHDLLEDALAAFACVATGAARAAPPGSAVPAAVRAVRELPLLRDGRGRPLSLASLDARDGSPLFLWRGDDAPPEVLAPWADDVVWCRGGLVERALAGLPLADAGAMVEQAKLGAERRRAFLRHATGEPVVPPAPEHALRAAFQVDEGPLAGLRGELAVFADDPGARRRAEVRVFVEGRHLETVELDPAAVPLPIEIALAWEGRVRPRFAYDGVERDERFWRAVRHALHVALAAADAEARRLFGPRAPPPGGGPLPPPPPDSELARMRPPLRAAIGTLYCAPQRLGADSAEHGDRRVGAPRAGEDLAPSAFKGLLEARLWPMLGTDRFMSLKGFAVFARAARGLCVAAPDARGRAPDRRPVLAATQRELDWLAAALPDCPLVAYAPGLFTDEELAARGPARRRALAASLEKLAAPRAAGMPVIEVAGDGFLALATPSDATVEAWHHASQPLATLEATPLLGHVAVAIDDDAAVPGRAWSGLLSPRNAAAVEKVERALCEALVAALEGDAAARARLGLEGDPLRERARRERARVVVYLLDCARALAERARRAPLDPALGELAARIRRLPLLVMLDARGEEAACSLEELDGNHPSPAPIPVLDAAPGFETLSWRPLLVRDASEHAALARWAGGRLLPANGRAPARRRRAAAERARRDAPAQARGDAPAQERLGAGGPPEERPARGGAAGGSRAPLALPGAPPHPLLRVSIAALGIHEIEGELEIIEGPASDVRLVDPDGAERRAAVELPIPLRVVARAAVADPPQDEVRALLTRLARAAGRRLLSLAPRFDELPPFARIHTRRAVLRTLAQGKRVVAEAASARLFPDIDGNLFSLDDLRRDPLTEWLCTATPPPYPKQRYGRPVLALSRPERLQLATAVLIKDITHTVARDQAAEARLSAPPLDTIALGADARAACLAVFPFAPEAGAQLGAPAAHGEIGLLAPEHAAAAGIAVHVGRRPLCAIDAGEGWPLCAAINDDTLEPNRAFDGLKVGADAARIRQAVRDAAARWLRARLAPPGDALATRWIDVATVWHRPLLVTGALWLPARWPRAPRVLVAAPSAEILGEGAARAGFAPRALLAGNGAGGLVELPPVEGLLLVWPLHEARWDAVAEIAMEAAASMSAELSDETAAAPYLWNLHLLGRLSGSKLAARTAAGERVGPEAIRAELSAKGCVWITDRRGSADGDFPEGAPAFVLLDDGSPLVEVLRHRAAPGVLRELGALAAPPSPTGAIATKGEPTSGEAAAAGGAPAVSRNAPAASRNAPAAPTNASAAFRNTSARAGGVLPDPSAGAADAPPSADAPPDVSGARAWMGALWRSVRGLIGGGAAPARREATAASPLAAALHAALVEMGLEGSPVLAVVESRAGRPVRYDAGRGHIVVNVEHEALAWLRARGGAPDPAAVALLAAAAVGEVNRALQSVTDAEERRALDHLLRSMG
ncbi:hypothetical protein [Sorangium sp. So ce513]|uniref:hypothetical protein n=1 Tax=Sorangium sp. So ce513 TaxID=3133315 RepID=UPI003F5EA973